MRSHFAVWQRVETMNESGAQERPAHGGLNISELDSLGLCRDEIIDFSASVNPLGPSLRAVEAARNADLGDLPRHRLSSGCETPSANTSGTDPGNLLVGNGSTELIHLLARAYLKGEASVLVFSPTFGEYEAACRLQGVAPVVLSPCNTGFHWDVQAAIHRITGLRPSVVFLCNPNNPTGIYLQSGR